MKAKFEIVRGTTKQMYVNVFTDDTFFYRQAISDTATVTLYVSKTKNNATPELTKSMTVFNSASGIVTCTFAIADTENMDSGDYWAEVQITNAGPTIKYVTSPILFRIIERVKD